MSKREKEINSFIKKYGYGKFLEIFETKKKKINSKIKYKNIFKKNAGKKIK